MHRIRTLQIRMGAAAAKTANEFSVKVQPHVPLIKFPSRLPAPKLKEGVRSATAEAAVVLKTTTTKTGSNSTSKKSGAPVIEAFELPQKYRRKLISAEEIEVIEKGGKV